LSVAAVLARHPGAELRRHLGLLRSAGLPYVTSPPLEARRRRDPPSRPVCAPDRSISSAEQLRPARSCCSSARRAPGSWRRGAALLRAIVATTPCSIATSSRRRGGRRAHEAAGLLELSLPAAAVAAAAALIPSGEGPLVALAPGARWATKRWPAARFAALGDALAAAGARLVLAGGPGDAAELDATLAVLHHPVVADTRGLAGMMAARPRRSWSERLRPSISRRRCCRSSRFGRPRPAAGPARRRRDRTAAAARVRAVQQPRHLALPARSPRLPAGALLERSSRSRRPRSPWGGRGARSRQAGRCAGDAAAGPVIDRWYCR
jgi:hypothetical protein